MGWECAPLRESEQFLDPVRAQSRLLTDPTERLTSIHQLQRRVCEAFGQRDTVKYAVTRVVRSLVDWDCLKQQKKTGSYSMVPLFRIHEPELTSWLLEAILISRNQSSMSLDQVESNPILFPFDLASIREAVCNSTKRLSITRHGLDVELLERNLL